MPKSLSDLNPSLTELETIRCPTCHRSYIVGRAKRDLPVDAIKKDIQNGHWTLREIAAHYNVSASTVSAIKNGKRS